MRTRGFAEQIRQAADVNRIILPSGERTYRSWPLCLTCMKEVDACELKDACQTSVELWASCHGAEDHYKVLFPFRIEGDPMKDERANWAIKRALHDFCPFDPAKVNESLKPSLLIL